MTCALCGRTEDEQPLTWMTSVEPENVPENVPENEHRRTRLYCDQCSRENVRSIEGKLDSDWW